MKKSIIEDKTPQLLNVHQAAQLLAIHVGTIRRWAQQGKLLGLKVGSRGDWRFKKEDLLELAKSNHDNHLSRRGKA